jgi:chromosome segregation and condensation protein ScpB
LRLVAGGYQLITKPEHHAELRQLFADVPEPPTPFSRVALETPAAIALQQPVTAAEVQGIRGIRNSDTIGPIKEEADCPAAHAPTRGHPRAATGQRKEFEGEFGLNSLEDLRSLRPATSIRPAGTNHSDSV